MDGKWSMNWKMRVGVLSLVASLQVILIAGGFIAYQQMHNMLWNYMMLYKGLLEQTGGPIIDYVVPNPFMPLVPIVTLSLFLTIVLIVDEIHQRKIGN